MKSTVKDIMTARVAAVPGSASFKEIAALLRAERVSAFPVTDDHGKVVGVVSEADMLPKETLDAGWAAGIPEMTAHILYGRDQEKAESVTAAEGRLVGIISRADVLSVFDRPDEEIRKEITEELVPNELRANPDRFEVTVKGGIVTRGGSPETAALGHAVVGRSRPERSA